MRLATGTLENAGVAGTLPPALEPLTSAYRWPLLAKTRSNAFRTPVAKRRSGLDPLKML